MPSNNKPLFAQFHDVTRPQWINNEIFKICFIIFSNDQMNPFSHQSLSAEQVAVNSLSFIYCIYNTLTYILSFPVTRQTFQSSAIYYWTVCPEFRLFIDCIYLLYVTLHVISCSDQRDPFNHQTLTMEEVVLNSVSFISWIYLSFIVLYIFCSSDQTDPFNRQPLTMEQVVPDEELRARVEEWLRQQKPGTSSSWSQGF